MINKNSTLTPNKKNALGRGLQAILKDSSYFTEKGNINPLREIPIDQIEVNPKQPRKEFNTKALAELQASIALHGIIQPLTVRQIEPKRYQLIAGERRLKAAIAAGLTVVPAYIRLADDVQVLEMSLVENIQRENLNPIEIALTYQRLLSECQIKQEELGCRVGKDRTTVNNYLRLLKLPPAIQIALRDQKISMGHARALINVGSTDAQLQMMEDIIQQNLPVREIESLARNTALCAKITNKNDKYKAIAASRPITVDEVMHPLKEKLDTTIKVHTVAKGNGEIRITFKDITDLHRIINLLSI